MSYSGSGCKTILFNDNFLNRVEYELSTNSNHKAYFDVISRQLFKAMSHVSTLLAFI